MGGGGVNSGGWRVGGEEWGWREGGGERGVGSGAVIEMRYCSGR